jgi:hypothetical protein
MRKLYTSLLMTAISLFGNSSLDAYVFSQNNVSRINPRMYKELSLDELQNSRLQYFQQNPFKPKKIPRNNCIYEDNPANPINLNNQEETSENGPADKRPCIYQEMPSSKLLPSGNKNQKRKKPCIYQNMPSPSYSPSGNQERDVSPEEPENKEKPKTKRSRKILIPLHLYLEKRILS